MHKTAYLAIFLVVLAATSARADFIIDIGNATINPGSTGTLDVMIRSDSIGGDPLSSFSFQFVITTGGSTRLEFVSPQSDSQLTNPSYVFFGDSLNQTSSSPVGSVTTGSVPNDTFTGGDLTNSGGDVTVTTDKLLARLDLTAVTALPPVAGNTFTLSLIAANSSFEDSSFTPINFTSTSGTVTIGSPQAVPEPGAIVLLSLGLAGLAGAAYRRSQRRSRETPCSGQVDGGTGDVHVG